MLINTLILSGLALLPASTLANYAANATCPLYTTKYVTVTLGAMPAVVTQGGPVYANMKSGPKGQSPAAAFNRYINGGVCKACPSSQNANGKFLANGRPNVAKVANGGSAGGKKAVVTYKLGPPYKKVTTIPAKASTTAPSGAKGTSIKKNPTGVSSTKATTLSKVASTTKSSSVNALPTPQNTTPETPANNPAAPADNPPYVAPEAGAGAGAGTPETPAPEATTPETPAPEEDTPAAEEPAADEPVADTPAPDTPAPDTPAPDTPAPDTPAPDTPAPDTPAPDAPADDGDVPDTTDPNACGNDDGSQFCYDAGMCGNDQGTEVKPGSCGGDGVCCQFAAYTPADNACGNGDGNGVEYCDTAAVCTAEGGQLTKPGSCDGNPATYGLQCCALAYN